MEYFSSTLLLRWALLAGTFLVIFSFDSAAQQTAPAAASGDPPLTSNGATTTAKQTPGTSKDRLFFTFPNFLTLEDAGNVSPLRSSEKFKVVTQSSFDYVKFFWYGALAGIGQAANSQSGYGQGAAGYGKRYGAAFTDGTIEDYMTSAILPSLLHQDPRYFQLGKGSFWRRSGYAVSRIDITHTDSGRQQVNYSEILDSALASAIPTYSYYPRGDRNLANALSLWGSQMFYDTLGHCDEGILARPSPETPPIQSSPQSLIKLHVAFGLIGPRRFGKRLASQSQPFVRML